jgi:hypothetical protein
VSDSSPNRFLSVADVADRLSLDPSIVIALIRSGSLPAVDVALPGFTRRRLRIAVADYKRFWQRDGLNHPQDVGIGCGRKKRRLITESTHANSHTRPKR